MLISTKRLNGTWWHCPHQKRLADDDGLLMHGELWFSHSTSKSSIFLVKHIKFPMSFCGFNLINQMLQYLLTVLLWAAHQRKTETHSQKPGNDWIYRLLSCGAYEIYTNLDHQYFLETQYMSNNQPKQTGKCLFRLQICSSRYHIRTKWNLKDIWLLPNCFASSFRLNLTSPIDDRFFFRVHIHHIYDRSSCFKNSSRAPTYFSPLIQFGYFSGTQLFISIF